MPRIFNECFLTGGTSRPTDFSFICPFSLNIITTLIVNISWIICGPWHLKSTWASKVEGSTDSPSKTIIKVKSLILWLRVTPITEQVPLGRSPSWALGLASTVEFSNLFRQRGRNGDWSIYSNPFSTKRGTRSQRDRLSLLYRISKSSEGPGFTTFWCAMHPPPLLDSKPWAGVGSYGAAKTRTISEVPRMGCGEDRSASLTPRATMSLRHVGCSSVISTWLGGAARRSGWPRASSMGR